MKFPCTQCGCCCKKIGLIKMFIKFPYESREDGSCEMYEDGLCKVYDNRPKICNVEYMAKQSGRSIENYYKDAIKVCNKMMDEDGIDIKLRIHGE